MYKTIKHKENPFISGLVINKKSKQVSVTKMGSSNDVLINQSTGEIKGTHVVSYKEVDKEEFVKIFTANISLTFSLKPAGQKIFNMLLRTMQNNAISRDKIDLSRYELEEFNNEFNLKISTAVLSRGIRDLILNKIIAGTEKQGVFFINPSFIFNGNRIAFTNAYEIK